MAILRTVHEVITEINEIDCTIRHIRDIFADVKQLKQLDGNETAALENACDELADYVEMLKKLPIREQGGTK